MASLPVNTGAPGPYRRVDFPKVAEASLRNADRVVRALLPGGRIEGAEWVVKNPRRADHKAGSFKVNLASGKWADFASGQAGGDLVSLAAFTQNLSQREAAIRLAGSLGVDPFAGGGR